MLPRPKKNQTTYYLKTFGCQMNKSDSERLAAVMATAGLQLVSQEQAKILVVNTCSVRQSAADRAAGQISLGRQRGQKIVITGCLAKQPDFIRKYQTQTLFVPIEEIGDLPRLIAGQTATKGKKRNYLTLPAAHSSPVEAYVPIMTGCNNYCSYCVVPYVRGRERSRPITAVLAEIKTLVKKGYRQITLLGQNVNSYHCGRTDFPKLLERVANLPGDFRVFFVTSHPKDFSRRLVVLAKKNPKICPYFHLPVQAGSDRVLRRMNRRYTRKQYLSLIKVIRENIPGAAVTTDIIVGFPGETKQDFKQTVRLFDQVKFDLAYIARYSPRPGTASAQVMDNVSLKEKTRRAQLLEQTMKKHALDNNKKLIGSITRVLVSEVRRLGKTFVHFGKSDIFKTVKFVAPENYRHRFVSVKITGANYWGLYGQLV